MLPKLKKVMVQCFVTEEKRRSDSWLCIIVSLPREQVKSRQRRKGSKTVCSQEKPLFAAEKEWRSTGIVLGLLVSMTKKVLFASLLVGVLRFNYKGRKYQDSFPKEDFPPEAWEHFLLDHISKRLLSYPLMSLYKTQETILFSLWLPFAEKGSDEKVKIEGKICSERAAKAMEKKTVYNKKQLSRITKTKKNQKTKTKRNKFTPATKNPSLIIVVSPLRSLASSQTKGGLQRQFVKRRSRFTCCSVIAFTKSMNTRLCTVECCSP